MRTHQYAHKKRASQSFRTPVSRPSEVQSSVQPPPIQAKSNEEGLAEHAERLKKFQRLGNPFLDKGPPRFDNDMTSPLQPKPWIQRKLTLGQPGDKYEQEADRYASQVVQQINAPISTDQTHRQSVQRKKAQYGEMQANCIRAAIQRRQAIPSGEASVDLESSINSARGRGQPLDAGLQQSMGQAMGADFSGVKVHTDNQSDQLNQSIQARAFTTGQDVFFQQGAYQPGSLGGQELIAHELTHVVQQNGKVLRRTPESPSVSMDNRVVQAKDELATNSEESPAMERFRKTALPDSLKTGIENISGYSMDDVRVHYNSAKPTQLQADAYAKGTDIYVAPGKEKHLPHEAWHVVQQKQGRVQPTIQYKGAAINTDAKLEKEADLKGLAALKESNQNNLRKYPKQPMSNTNVYQLNGIGWYALAAVGGAVATGLTVYLANTYGQSQAEKKKQKIITDFETRMKKSGFVDNAKMREDTFVLAAMKEGLDETVARKLFEKSGAAAKDVVTGFDLAADRKPSVQKAIEYISKNIQATGFYVEVDIRNLGGLNSVLGHTGADEVFKVLAQECSKSVNELKTNKVKVAEFRHGGDEFSFLVVDELGNVKIKDVEEQMDLASRMIEKFVGSTPIKKYKKNVKEEMHEEEEQMLASIEHPKHKGKKKYYGTGIVFGVSKITGKDEVNDVISTADLKVEARKK